MSQHLGWLRILYFDLLHILDIDIVFEEASSEQFRDQKKLIVTLPVGTAKAYIRHDPHAHTSTYADSYLT